MIQIPGITNPRVIHFRIANQDLDDVGKEVGIKEYNRIVWEKTDDNTVRQTWSVSADAGESWDVVFDGEYRRKSE